MAKIKMWIVLFIVGIVMILGASENYYNLTFSLSVETSLKSKSTNPKRIQREVMKVYRRAAGREERKAEQERKRELKQQKRKQKHRGR
ncbi:MAG TPA: YjdF family protein [Candidatus Mediterraneibacter surreyensis]|nr:YjdF family protein [Candidatus Mediterraneibacter surreyensis]